MGGVTDPRGKCGHELQLAEVAERRERRRAAALYRRRYESCKAEARRLRELIGRMMDLKRRMFRKMPLSGPQNNPFFTDAAPPHDRLAMRGLDSLRHAALLASHWPRSWSPRTA